MGGCGKHFLRGDKGTEAKRHKVNSQEPNDNLIAVPGFNRFSYSVVITFN
jgi:hypothetical protein